METRKIESGAQLFSRLNKKPFLEGINPYFFPEGGPHPNQVIEITGDAKLDKSDLLMDFIVKSILPCEYSNEWKGSGTIFINTEFRINLFKIIKVIETHLNKYNIQISRKDIIESSLKNLTIFNCYSLDELTLTFHNLEKILFSNDNISLIIIDNIAAHYWIAKLNDNFLSYFQHSINMFEIIYEAIKNLNILFIFVRHERNDMKKNMQKIDFRIDIEDIDNNFNAVITNYGNESAIQVPFKIQTILEFNLETGSRNTDVEALV